MTDGQEKNIASAYQEGLAHQKKVERGAWILFAALSLAGGANYLIKQEQSAVLKDGWQHMVEDDGNDVQNQWTDLTPQQLQNFITAGVDVTTRNNQDGRTPLHYVAANSGSVYVIKELIGAGANIHAKDYSGGTPLHQAATNSGSVYVIKELINAGADINAKDNSDGTPLHQAATNSGNVYVIKELINAGADVNAKSESGRTPCDLLEKNYKLKNNSEAKKLLCF